MSNVVPHAQSPDLRSAHKALVRFLEHHRSQLTPEQIEAGVESKRRLRRLESDANRLIRINNALLDEESPKLTFDEHMETIPSFSKELPNPSRSIEPTLTYLSDLAELPLWERTWQARRIAIPQGPMN